VCVVRYHYLTRSTNTDNKASRDSSHIHVVLLLIVSTVQMLFVSGLGQTIGISVGVIIGVLIIIAVIIFIVLMLHKKRFQ